MRKVLSYLSNKTAPLSIFCYTLVLLLLTHQTQAQCTDTPMLTSNGTTVSATGTSGICLFCSITNSNNIVSTSTSDYGTVSIPVGVLASGYVKLRLPQTYPAGTRVGWIADVNGGIAGLFNGVTLRAYMNGTLVGSVSGGSLFNILGFGGGRNINGVFCNPFNEVEITMGSLAGVLANYNIYNAYITTGCSFPVQCGSATGTEICGDNIDNDGDGLVDNEDICSNPCVAGSAAPALNTTTKSNICPSNTIDLTSITASNQPNGTTLTWHTGTPASNANKITGSAVAAGTYYAAFFDATNNCYSNSGNGTTAVTAIINVCSGGGGNGCLGNITMATVNTTISGNLQSTGAATMSIVAPSTTVNVGITSTTSSNTFWGVYPGSVTSKTLNVNGASTTFNAQYLDMTCNFSNTPTTRTVGFSFPQNASALSNATYDYQYMIGIAGLGGSAVENGTDVFSTSLTVIDNVDMFNTGTYGLVNGQTPAPGMVTTAISTRTASATTSQGYTFFWIPKNVSSFTMNVTGLDAHGFIFGLFTSNTSITPNLAATNVQNTCPTTTINLSSTATNLPANSSLTWHTGTPATGTNRITTLTGLPTGTYYAAFLNTTNNCYNGTDGAKTTAVTATSTTCCSFGSIAPILRQ